MNALDAIDPLAKTARVQPGIVLDRLRDAANSITSPTRPTPQRIRAAPSAASSATTVAASTAC